MSSQTGSHPDDFLEQQKDIGTQPNVQPGPQQTESYSQVNPEPQPETPPPILAKLPEIPSTDLCFDFASILGGSSSSADQTTSKVSKRASNVERLTAENENLREQLKAMSARLEAAEERRRRVEQEQRR